MRLCLEGVDSSAVLPLFIRPGSFDAKQVDALKAVLAAGF
jgi:hypothetical protein